ncbi:response regulator transcription factor [Bombilactobacillus folatiphilus]|uniref:Response regulator transcription factor n=1 Tax=Bombilactobacillus folatiphilus TaxID=2923362 RepID=A0ABY4P7M5_9LACO|nr:response regulator transcription factor [Bombilactobacillus folatiphilus]UQS81694.1 response regulator transcription factor [Bombilactobacillus folatiphilus]
MKKILVVDDEPALVELLKYNLEQNHYFVVTAFDGQQALNQIAQQEFDLILLDLMLPKINGLQLMQQLRTRQNLVPIIILTAKDQADQKVQGLNLGADDYVTKPFEVKELLARINAVLRRQKAVQPTTSLVLDRDNFEVLVRGQLVSLTKTEYKLFDFLYVNANRTLTREQLMEHLWQQKPERMPDSRAIDIQISHLRDKIEQDPKRPQYLQTIRGFGYRLTLKGD